MAGSTITSKVTVGVTLGSSSYVSPLIVALDGEIAPSAYGITALTGGLDAGDILNDGVIVGGTGSNSGAGTSGIGVYLIAGSLTNAGTISGGMGGADGIDGFGSNGGVGVRLANGNVTNTGTIVGGAANNNGFMTNGGAGVDMTAGSLTNNGVVIGGAGSNVPEDANVGGPGSGGYGVYLVGGNLLNAGTIIGGMGGLRGGSTFFGGSGGVGVCVVTGSLTNIGTIIGGSGGAGQTGVVLRYGGTLADGGFIGGGTGDVINGAQAIYFGGGTSRLILEPTASFYGGIDANSSISNVLELVAGSSIGTIAGLSGPIVPPAVIEPNAVNGFGTLQFDTGALWHIEGDATGLAAGQTIDGFALGDTIELTGFAAMSGSFTAAGLVLTGTTSSETIGIAGHFTTDEFAISNNGTGTFVELGPPCFAAGTRIRTPCGDVPVEQLRPGEAVLVRRGSRQAVSSPIVWMGHRSVACDRHPEPWKVRPVLVSAGAFAEEMPQCDLRLSPDHAVLVGSVLIPIKYLINGTSISQVPVDKVTYYHVELSRHDVLLAEGLPVESYLDAGNRSDFFGARGPITLYPDFASRVWEAEACAPLVITGSELDAVRTWVNARTAVAVLAGAVGKENPRATIRTS